MATLNLSFAISDYDHVRDLVTGKVRPQGIDLLISELTVEEIFFRTAAFQEWDIAEFSMANYVSLVSQGSSPLTALPVFPSRVFRHSAIYVRADAGIREPRDLVGRRVGIPEWAQTAGVYVRGLLEHQFGVSLSDVEWFQSGLTQAGRPEKVPISLPDGVRLTSVRDRSLIQILLDGDLDAIISPREPRLFLDGDPRIRRLFPDYRVQEEAYYEKTLIFPIMHTIVVKRSILNQHPWAAMNLFTAFEEAKARSVARLSTVLASRIPMAWSADYVHRTSQIFGSDYWPYGITSNRPTLDAFLTYCHEQGVSARKVSIEELFPPQLATAFKV